MFENFFLISNFKWRHFLLVFLVVNNVHIIRYIFRELNAFVCLKIYVADLCLSLTCSCL
jgi:hypothetical protein